MDIHDLNFRSVVETHDVFEIVRRSVNAREGGELVVSTDRADRSVNEGQAVAIDTQRIGRGQRRLLVAF